MGDREIIGLCVVLVMLVAGCKREATYQGKPTSYWIKQSRDSDDSTRRAAYEALSSLPDQEAEDALRKLLVVPNTTHYERFLIADAIIYRTAMHDDVIPIICTEIKSMADDPGGLYATKDIALLISHMPTDAPKLVPALQYAKNKADRYSKQDVQDLIDRATGKP